MDRIGRRAVLVGSIIAQIPLLLGFMVAPSELVAGVFLDAIGFVTVMSFSVSVVMGQEYLPSRLGLASGVTLGLAIGAGRDRGRAARRAGRLHRPGDRDVDDRRAAAHRPRDRRDAAADRGGVAPARVHSVS